MGFGIKTKVRKHIQSLNHAIRYTLQHPVIIYKNLTTNVFPKNGFSKFKINLRLNAVLADLSTFDFKHNIGSISPIANRYAAKIYQKFISTNPNNIGNWSSITSEIGTQQIEHEVIQKMINLYHGQGLEGYVTSGGTEGNLYGIWVGKTFVTKHYNIHQICLIRTVLTHYSVDKACSMCSINQINIPLNSKTWGMDPVSLEAEIIKQSHESAS